MTEADRKVTAGRILLKWGGYVEKVHGQNRKDWAAGLWPSLASADLDNLQKASRAVTYEGMRNALLGKRLDDEQIIDRMARASLNVDTRGIDIKRLGDASGDLVFTPINTCRVADTRNIKSPIAAGQTRTLSIARPGGDFTNQGGVDNDCNIPANPAAVALSVVGLKNSTEGFLRVFPASGTLVHGSTVPLSTINTQAVTNDMIVEASQGCNSCLNVFSTANTDFAVFVTGYFMAPQATALECVEQKSVATEIKANQFGTVTTACPTAFRITGMSCETDSISMRIITTKVSPGNNSASCKVINVAPNTAAIDLVTAKATCCRVPGR